jgi:hypothetical protein
MNPEPKRLSKHSMPSNSRVQSAGTGRSLIYIALCILLVVIGVVIFNLVRSDKVSDRENGARNQTAAGGSLHSSSPQAHAGEEPSGPRKTRSTNRKAGEVEDLVPGQFPLVERIVSDTNQTDSVAAERLAEIARRSNVSVEERYEALAHGLNLDFKSFSNFAMEPDLPLELAQRFFDELLNQNRNPILQIEGCVALLSHTDKDLQTQAADQLAFLVEKESLAESPEELRKAALERLDFLRKNPPIEEPNVSSAEDFDVPPE